MLPQQYIILPGKKKYFYQVWQNYTIDFALVNYFHDVFRNEKVISYTDDLEVPLTNWVDETSWPSFQGLVLQVSNPLNVSFSYYLSTVNVLRIIMSLELILTL